MKFITITQTFSKCFRHPSVIISKNLRRAEKTAEAAKYDAFGPNHGSAFRPFDCGRTA